MSSTITPAIGLIAKDAMSAGTFEISIFMNDGNIGRAKLRNIKMDAAAERSAVVVISLAVREARVSVDNLRPPSDVCF
jgi:hypothetical protein